MSKHSSRNRSDAKPLELVLPATSANLGPAFDAAALALKLFLKVRAQIAPDFSLQARGRDSEVCGRIKDHLILTTYWEVLQAEAMPVRPLAVRIENQIPIGKGCGSSAAARLAGIALAVEFGGLRWTDSQIVGEASRREHHPDNAAACWMGSLAVAGGVSGDGEAQIARVAPRGNWPLLMAVPPQTLSTEQARRVLPSQYSRADAVANVQNSMLLLAAFTQGRSDLLASALDDRLHQPYRASLCPLLPALKKLPAGSGVLGVTLSGAGPSVLIFLDSKGNWARAKPRIAAHLRKCGLAAELISTGITGRGARDANGWKTRRITK
jgi:homoserine kinase